MNHPAVDRSAGQCKQCGTCCRKGGPSIHREDQSLIESGAIQIRHLFTIRKGELVRDNVRGGFLKTDGDIIKIKGQGDSWRCTFFDDGSNRCRIYAQRPIECRALACWNTHAIEDLYNRDRLTRRDTLAPIEGLWELVEDHQQRCAYEALGEAVKIFNQPHDDKAEAEARDQILATIRYDASLRQVAVDKGGIDPAQLDFLFGRPLTQTIKMFRINLCVTPDKRLILSPVGHAND
jgi:Fe-S-cluster containining protein